jgi:hypothetical protein
MGETITKMPSPFFSWPVIPQSLRMVLALGIPVLVTAWVLWRQLSSLPSEAWVVDVQPIFLISVLALAPLNWGLETFKWAALMPKESLSRRCREVLYGTAWSLIGPLRLGAAIGRVSAVQKQHRSHALHAFAVSSVSQWWCTITAAAVALCAVGFYTLSLVVFGICAVSISLYFQRGLKVWDWVKTFQAAENWQLARRMALGTRKRALNLSIARYLVMLTQFILALQAFGHLAHGSATERLMDQSSGSALTWGLTSLAPVPMLGDLGLREAAALLALPAPNPEDVTAILCATLSLWVINLILPATAGLLWHGSVLRAKH